MHHVLRTRVRRLALCATLAAASVMGAASVTAAAAGYPAPTPTPAPTIDWADCDRGFQCATIAVPLDYDKPSGATITLALIRLPATDQAHRKGSLFINPGGPGGSGVGAVRGKAEYYPSAVRAAYDIVGFDPRGVGDSTPIQCFTTAEAAMAAQQKTPFPVTRKEKVEWRAENVLLAKSCKAEAGPILDHMSTANVARDMDFLRRAVGDEKLNYVGFSYGTYLGMTYANMFPDTVGAFVIDGVLDPVAWSTGYGKDAKTLPFTTRIDSDLGSEETLDQFFTLCDAAGEGCAFAGNSRARYDALAARIKIAPVPFPDFPQLLVTYQAFIRLTLLSLYNPSSWPDTAELFAAMEAGSGSAAQEALTTLETSFGLTAAPAPVFPPVDATATVGCLDTVNPPSFNSWIRAADFAAQRSPHFGRLWTWASSVCRFWRGHDRDRYLGPWNSTTANPVLIVGNYYDPSTPYSGAVTASELLPNSRLLSYAGWGHLAFGVVGNDCVDDAVVQYLVGGVLPAEGTVCEPAASPFDTGAADQSKTATTTPFTTRPIPAALSGN